MGNVAAAAAAKNRPLQIIKSWDACEAPHWNVLTCNWKPRAFILNENNKGIDRIGEQKEEGARYSSSSNNKVNENSRNNIQRIKTGNPMYVNWHFLEMRLSSFDRFTITHNKWDERDESRGTKKRGEKKRSNGSTTIDRRRLSNDHTSVTSALS